MISALFGLLCKLSGIFVIQFRRSAENIFWSFEELTFLHLKFQHIHSLVMNDDVIYLIRPKRAKNILQNEVASDFVFILKMRKNPRNFCSQNDRDRPDSNL